MFKIEDELQNIHAHICMYVCIYRAKALTWMTPLPPVSRTPHSFIRAAPFHERQGDAHPRSDHAQCMTIGTTTAQFKIVNK